MNGSYFLVTMLILMFTDQNPFLEAIKYPPGSMIFILLLSTLVACISTGLTKLLVDTKELNRKQLIIKKHQEEKGQVIKLAEIDPRRYRKARKRWERKDIMLKQTQQRMALQRLKPTCVTFLPMIIIFSILNTTVFAGRAPVAIPPMNANDLPLLAGIISASTNDKALEWTILFYGEKRVIQIQHGWISFTAWYFICSLGINTMLQRLLKIQTQASGGMEQMFKGQKTSAMQFPDI